MPSEPAWPRLVATSGDAWIWLADLDAADADDRAPSPCCPSDEQARAGRFVFDVHRRRFVACRAALRTLLAERLGLLPPGLRFEYGPAGKPSLAGGAGLRFNVSHSDRYALLAMAEGAELGVDIERLRPLRDMDLVAERVFSAAEREALGSVPADRKVGGLFRRLDAQGGLHQGPRRRHRAPGAVEVALAPGDPPRLIRVAGQPDEPDAWSLGRLARFRALPPPSASRAAAGAGTAL